MSTYLGFNIASGVADRVTATMRALHLAEKEAASFINVEREGIACDSAESVYRETLRVLGFKEAELSGLDANTLRVILKSQPLPGSRAARAAPPMAFDSSRGSSVLDSILGGIEPPRDESRAGICGFRR